MHRIPIHRALCVGSLVVLIAAAASAQNAITGVVGLEDLSMSGKSYIDSYDSSAPGGYKASKSKGALVLTNGQITISGGGGVDGSALSTRSGIVLSGGSRITGVVSYSTDLTRSGGAVTSDALRQTIPQLSAQRPGKCEGYPPQPSGAEPWIKGNFVYDAVRGDLLLAGATVTLRAGTYCLNNIALSGGSSLNVDGPVMIRMNGSLDLSGGSSVNKNGRPSAVQISSASTRGGLSLTGMSQAFVTVFAPSWHIGLSGGSALFGSLVGQSIAASGDSALHHDISLGSPIP